MSGSQAFARKGFTIVELLIVIVVIAILAAISIVAFNGIQQRANNSSIISAAKGTLSTISSYIAANDSYPVSVNGTWCVTTTSGCVINGAPIAGNSSFDTNMATIGTLPRSIPMSGSDQTGIAYSYSSSRTYNGDAQPALLYYTLYGTSQSCGISGVITGWLAGIPSTTGYTSSNSSTGKTICYIHIPGPNA